MPEAYTSPHPGNPDQQTPAAVVQQNWLDAAPAPIPQAIAPPGVNGAERAGCMATSANTQGMRGITSTLLRGFAEFQGCVEWHGAISTKTSQRLVSSNKPRQLDSLTGRQLEHVNDGFQINPALSV